MDLVVILVHVGNTLFVTSDCAVSEPAEHPDDGESQTLAAGNFTQKLRGDIDDHFVSTSPRPHLFAEIGANTDPDFETHAELMAEAPFTADAPASAIRKTHKVRSAPKAMPSHLL